MDEIPTTAVPQLYTVGVIGGGQLAWMLLDAAQDLGLEVMVQTPHTTDPAIGNRLQVGSKLTVKAILAPVADAAATARLAQHCQVITFENEFVNIPDLRSLETQGTCFRPSLSVLEALLDKYEQHVFLQSLGLRVPTFAPIAPQEDPQTIGFNFPFVLKSRRYGYDGQGTFIIRDAAQLEQFWQRFAAVPEIPSRFMIEAFVPFERELAIMAARTATGEIALYPVVETYQKQQVCRWAISPATLAPALQTQIQNLAAQLLAALKVVGILGIELFLTPDGEIFVNEIAPRTHNSGHLTIDACATSQFEQHLRAVCDLPLGDPSLRVGGAVMVNLLGFETAQADYLAQRQRLAAIPNATVHWYGKSAAKPGRKLGHVTVLLDSADRDKAIALAQQIEALWYPSSTAGANRSS
jgi:5-(carboxyamino)imidazole ribonucleotide synthase